MKHNKLVSLALAGIFLLWIITLAGTVFVFGHFVLKFW